MGRYAGFQYLELFSNDNHYHFSKFFLIAMFRDCGHYSIYVLLTSC